MTNRIDDPAYVQVKAQLSASLDAWRRQVDGR
jgi:hypothetical protein